MHTTAAKLEYAKQAGVDGLNLINPVMGQPFLFYLQILKNRKGRMFTTFVTS